MSYTPGPWTVEHSRISWWIEAPTDKSRFISGPIPADVWHQEKEQRDNCEALQNARLIAAAPDLLEALELVVRRCGPDSDDGKLARAAIALAKGSAS